MVNGYKIFWTDHALNELQKTITYLEENWTQKEISNLVVQLEDTLRLIAVNPTLFQSSDLANTTRRAIVAKHNTMYYRIKNDTVEILSFFSNRRNPKKRKLR